MGSFTFLDTFLDIRDLVNCCGERGLLGLAFHPSYASNGYFFVYYTEGDGDVVIARYRAPSANSNTANSASARILLTIGHSTYGNHNGGGLAFGPDGYLYAAVGDGGGGGDPRQRPEPRDPPGQGPPGWTSMSPMTRHRTTRSRPTTRLLTPRARGRRSGLGASATPGASASTG